MRISLKSIMAAGSAVLLAAMVSPAFAGDSPVHILTVPLPGGGIEQIQYTGDVAPRVVLLPVGAATASAFDPFAALERITAMMDQQAAAMLRQVDALPGGMMGILPPGAGGYSLASSSPATGVCMQSVQITYNGGDSAPKVVSRTSGDCGRGGGVPAGVGTPAPAPRVLPGTIEARANRPARVAWNR